MARWGLVLLVVAAALVGLKKGCGHAASAVDFTATWIRISENGIAGTQEESTVTVWTLGRLFRIEEKQKGEMSAFGRMMGDTVITQLFDGSQLYTKQVYFSSFGDGSASAGIGGGATTDETPPSIQPMKDHQTGPLRFWARPFSGPSAPGGMVAGRSTILYQARDNRPEGEVTVQAWVDAETRVVLKYVSSIYSKQIGQIVTRHTDECQSFKMGDVDKDKLAKI